MVVKRKFAAEAGRALSCGHVHCFCRRLEGDAGSWPHHRLTLDALETHVRAGVTTARLDEVAASVFAKHGARSAPAVVYGFPGTVLISINDEVVHGVPGPRRLERGDLVKLDVTVEKDGYVADAARSVVVGSGSETAHRLVPVPMRRWRRD